MDDRALAPVLDRLAAEPAVRRVVLFGSRARGDGHARSDLDLAVDAPGLSRAEWSRLWADVQEADTLLGIDLLLMREVPAALLSQIEADGRVVYHRHDAATPTLR